MAFDIYGENLMPGHCEVHPYVHETYPCSICLGIRDGGEKDRDKPVCDICGIGFACANSNGYAVCSEACDHAASDLPPAEQIPDLPKAIKQITALRAHLAACHAWMKEAGHLPGCEAERCRHPYSNGDCGMSKYSHGAEHQFKPGPCTCGHDRIVGSEGE